MSQQRILRAWAPLEAAWLLMAVEGPFIAAVIARLVNPTLNLAAFGVAFPFGMLFESPIILIMSASTALVVDRDSFGKLRRFTWGLNTAITLAMLIFVLPPIFALVTQELMGLPPAVAKLANGACALLLPWPAAIGYRRFFQGILIRHGLTRRVAYGTAIRLGSMGGTALALATFTSWPGAWVGCAALSVGVVLEAAASGLWAKGCVQELQQREPIGPLLTYGAIAHFYLPLAMTSILALGVYPMVSFFLGRSARPLESLAVMPVVNSFVFIFNTAGLTFQEVAIPMMGQGRETLHLLRRFATTTALAASGLLMLVAFTPLSKVWFRGVAGLTPQLAAFAALPVAILFIQPALTMLLSYQRAMLVVARVTRPITWATVVEVGSIAGLMLCLTQLCGWTGAMAAATTFVTGRALAGLYLMRETRQLFR